MTRLLAHTASLASFSVVVCCDWESFGTDSFIRKREVSTDGLTERETDTFAMSPL